MAETAQRTSQFRAMNRVPLGRSSVPTLNGGGKPVPFSGQEFALTRINADLFRLAFPGPLKGDYRFGRSDLLKLRHEIDVALAVKETTPRLTGLAARWRDTRKAEFRLFDKLEPKQTAQAYMKAEPPKRWGNSQSVEEIEREQDVLMLAEVLDGVKQIKVHTLTRAGWQYAGKFDFIDDDDMTHRLEVNLTPAHIDQLNELGWLDDAIVTNARRKEPIPMLTERVVRKDGRVWRNPTWFYRRDTFEAVEALPPHVRVYKRSDPQLPGVA